MSPRDGYLLTAEPFEVADLDEPSARIVQAIDRTIANRMVTVERGSMHTQSLGSWEYRWVVKGYRRDPDRTMTVRLEVMRLGKYAITSRTLWITQREGESSLLLKHARHTMTAQAVNIAIRDFELYGEF
jgi:hypothetical protein